VGGMQFAVAFTQKVQTQTKKTAYAQAAQVRAIRKKINEIIVEHVTTRDLKELVKVL
jgi:small subunit ribosomal protein S3Ae